MTYGATEMFFMQNMLVILSKFISYKMDNS